MLSQEQIARLLRNCSLYYKTLLAIIYDCAQGSVRHEYIARYAYRVAITNSRILDVTDSNVLYDYKDYRKGGKHGVMTLYFVSFVAYFEIVASLFVLYCNEVQVSFLIRKLPLAFRKPHKNRHLSP